MAVNVTASGHQLPLTVIFKAEPGGCIKRDEMPQYPADLIYAIQKGAWMDEAVMLQWVDKVLSPYINTQPVHVVSVSLLDTWWGQWLKKSMILVLKYTIFLEDILDCASQLMLATTVHLSIGSSDYGRCGWLGKVYWMMLCNLLLELRLCDGLSWHKLRWQLK